MLHTDLIGEANTNQTIEETALERSMMPSNLSSPTHGIMAGDASSPQKQSGSSPASLSGGYERLLRGFTWQDALLPVGDGGLICVGEGGAHDH